MKNKCNCRKGIERDNCPNCEGTGTVIDFKAIREGNKSQHTPGPWTVYEKWVVIDNTGRTVAEAVGQLDSNERFANARLIATAPDQLEASKDLYASLKKIIREGLTETLPEYVKDAIEASLIKHEKAIAKAEDR